MRRTALAGGAWIDEEPAFLSPHEADILQATLLKSFEHLPQFEQSDNASFMAWLAKIAENEIRDQADRQGRQRRDARLEVRLETGDDVVATVHRCVATGPTRGFVHGRRGR